MTEIHDHPKLDGYNYEMLMKHSRDFRQYSKMTKTNLINGIARRLYSKHGGRIQEHAKMVGLKKLANIDLAYWLYQLWVVEIKERNSYGKVETHSGIGQF